ncbi:MAG: glycosyltransferase family 2 protein [Anaerolineales bacterium]|nr:glycosyltransferase family 2 protein [Anaerolineales bacterium]MCB9128705.1 glycosyltransferase family 2 protein [Ardenticatenales bacterium]MCB9172615.1 glycosyltransferase family 2 protein [Ardenticatenales bacterium]
MLSIIIVSWNTVDLLRRCLASIEAERGTTALEIIVVDNGSLDGTPAMIHAEFPRVTVIESQENLGFSAGNNVGMAAAQGDFLLLLNPDTELTPGALSHLLDFMAAHPAVGLVGPELRYGDGSHQPSRRRFATLPTLFLDSTPLAPLLGPLRRRYYMADRAPDLAQPVDWLVGAALLIRRAVYVQVGGFDEQLFMYFEESDWQRRIKAAGWSIWYEPAARIIHHEGASSGQVVTQRHIHFNQSRIRYTAKWHGPRWARRLSRWLWLLFTWESLVEGAKWLLGHKRPLRAARLQSYATVRQALDGDGEQVTQSGTATQSS